MKLHIEDDGRGFAGIEALDQAALEGHVGVLGMRERVRTLGGTFLIRSRPGEGTVIDVEIPLVQLRVKSEPGSRRLVPSSRRRPLSE
jgi:signal transduction histidine kinase